MLTPQTGVLPRPSSPRHTAHPSPLVRRRTDHPVTSDKHPSGFFITSQKQDQDFIPELHRMAASVRTARGHIISPPSCEIRGAGARTRVRVTGLKTDHIIGRMAAVIVQVMDDHREVRESDIMRVGGFLPAEIRNHKIQAMALARKFAPHLFRATPDFGC